jgi:hypothetical protein
VVFPGDSCLVTTAPKPSRPFLPFFQRPGAWQSEQGTCRTSFFYFLPFFQRPGAWQSDQGTCRT